MASREFYYTIFGPGAQFSPIKCRTWQDVHDWFYFHGPFEITADENDPDTWDFAGGWFIEYNDGSHLEPEEWEDLETYDGWRKRPSE